MVMFRSYLVYLYYKIFRIDMAMPPQNIDLYLQYGWLAIDVGGFALLFPSGGNPIKGTCKLQTPSGGHAPHRKVLTARELIERGLAGWCLRCHLRVGDTRTSERTSVSILMGTLPSWGRDSKWGHSHSRWFRLPQANREGARRLVLALPSSSGDIPTMERTRIGDSDGDTPIPGVC